MVCRASGNYGVPFKAGRGVTQGGSLSAKLFNLLVDAVTWDWQVRLPQEAAKDHEEELIAELIWGFFAIFYVDDANFASHDPVFRQTALDILVKLFKQLGLETNRLKTQAMICTPGRIHHPRPNLGWHPNQLGSTRRRGRTVKWTERGRFEDVR